MPIPQLNVRYISCVATLPACCNHWNNWGNCHALASIWATVLAGKTRGTFSVMPPPVMCAMPLMVNCCSAAKMGLTYKRVGAMMASRKVFSPSKGASKSGLSRARILRTKE